MRASAVVKRQSTFMVSWLRWACHVLVSLCSASWSGIRRARHCRANTPSSISAMFSQLPCLGSVVNFPAAQRCAGPRQVQTPHTMRLGGGCSSCPSPGRYGPCPGSPHPPVSVLPAPSQPWCARWVTSTRRQPSKGANTMNRLLTPVALVFVIVTPGRPRSRWTGLTGFLHPAACWSRPGTPGSPCPRTGDDRPPARLPWRRQTRRCPGAECTSTLSARASVRFFQRLAHRFSADALYYLALNQPGR